MSKISAIIVDDEKLARIGLEQRLSAFSDIEMLDLCANGIEALAAITKFEPDVVFLDIEMPGLSGMQLIEQLHKNNHIIPQIIFTTAYERFALEAFDFQPCDYLLKPITDERLEQCIKRLTTVLQQQQALSQQHRLGSLLATKTGTTLNGFINNLENGNQRNVQDLQKTVSFKCGTEWIRLALQDLIWIEAAGDYMCLHTEGGPHIIRKTLKELEKELDTTCFPRVNRSAIVNLSKIAKLVPNSNGEYFAELTCGKEVKVSRKYKHKLSELSKNR